MRGRCILQWMPSGPTSAALLERIARTAPQLQRPGARGAGIRARVEFQDLPKPRVSTRMLRMCFWNISVAQGQAGAAEWNMEEEEEEEEEEEVGKAELCSTHAPCVTLVWCW